MILVKIALSLFAFILCGVACGGASKPIAPDAYGRCPAGLHADGPCGCIPRGQICCVEGDAGGEEVTRCL
jgi:hypothetical protein